MNIILHWVPHLTWSSINPHLLLILILKIKRGNYLRYFLCSIIWKIVSLHSIIRVIIVDLITSNVIQYISWIILCHAVYHWWKSILWTFFWWFLHLTWGHILLNHHFLLLTVKILHWLTKMYAILHWLHSINCFSLKPLILLHWTPSLLIVLASTYSSDLWLKIFHNLLEFSPLSSLLC